MKKRYSFLPKTRLTFKLAVALSASFSLAASAQSAAGTQWEKVIGGTAGDSPNHLLKTSDGGYILGGWSGSGIGGDKSQANLGNLDIWIVKTDANGNKQWDKTFGGNDQDVLQRIIQTPDGGYLLGGHSTSGISGDKSQASNGSHDYWIIRIDATGNKLWDKSFGGSYTEFLYGMVPTSDGGFLLGGMSASGISGDRTHANKGVVSTFDYWLVKVDANGIKQWDKVFGGNGEESFVNLKKTADGGFIISGFSDSAISSDKSQTGYGGEDFWIIKLDANCNKVWDKTLGGNLQEVAPFIEQTTDGGYIVAGSSKSGISGVKSQANLGDYDYWILKLDGSGNILWDKTYGGNARDELYQIHELNGGGFIVSGASASGASGDKSQASFGGFDYWAMVLNPNGSKAWDIALGGTLDDHLFDAQQTFDGGFILSGDSKSGVGGNKTLPGKGAEDFWMVKLGPILGTGDPVPAACITIFPNPNQGKLTLQLKDLPAPTAEVTVTDLSGQQVLPKTVAKTDENLPLDLGNAAKGIYLLQLKTEKQVIVKKVVVE